jgi:hypothetical protein
VITTTKRTTATITKQLLEKYNTCCQLSSLFFYRRTICMGMISGRSDEKLSRVHTTLKVASTRLAEYIKY